MRNFALRKFPYCLNLQLSTQQVCHRAHHSFARRKLCDFCTKGYTTLNKKTARSTSANVRKRASVQVTKTAVSFFTFGLGFYAQTVLWRFVPLHDRKMQAKTHTRGVGFEKI